MKKKLLLFITALLLISTGAFAQSGETPLKGDVNEDGKVDVADINAVIKIMKDAGGTAEETIYYFGTIKPNISNYQTLIPRYISSSEVYNKTVNVTGGNYIYYLCPSSHALTNEQRKNAMLDQGGFICKFSTTIDTTSITGYTIYQQLVDNDATLTFNINY